MGIIEDGTGTGKKVKVDEDNRLHVRSVTQSLEHISSREDKGAFQVSADVAIAASEQEILLIQNSDNDRDIVITDIKMGSVGAADANTSAFFAIKIGGTYGSGGTAVTPTNMFVGSSTPAVGTFVTGASTITAAGTFVEIDRLYDANTLVDFLKAGAIIIPSGQAMTICHTGSTTAGNAYCRISFYYEAVTDVG